MPTRLHLVRHGRVRPEWESRVYGDLDVPLAAEGEDQARRVARVLGPVPLAGVVSSGLERAEFGAALLRAGRGLARRDEPELREIRRGEWAGLGLDEIERRWPGGWARWWRDPASVRPPGGESLADLSARVVPALERLVAAHGAAELAVVGHSWVIRVAVCHALGLAPGAATRLDLPPGSMVALDWPEDAAGELERPVLAGFAHDVPPDRGSGWFRGPRRR